MKSRAAWCQRFSFILGDDAPLPGVGPFGAVEAFYLARLAFIHAQIALGNVQAARSILELQLNLASANSLMNRVIELTVLEAFASQVESDIPGALKALERAMKAMSALSMADLGSPCFSLRLSGAISVAIIVSN